MGSEKLLKWINVLLSQASDSGPQVCVAFSALCKHARQVGDEGLILQHKVILCKQTRKKNIGYS